MDQVGDDGGSSRAGELNWSPSESAVLERAVDGAPSVHDVRPWWLEIGKRRAVLHQQEGLELPRHDAEGRDLVISCGAALANLVLGVRSLGWHAQVRKHERGGAVATVTAPHRAEPTPEELRLHAAIDRRTSERRPFEAVSAPPVPWEQLPSGDAGEVALHRVEGERQAAAVARALAYAARVFRGDREYQRELEAWMVTSTGARGKGLRPEALGEAGLAAAGLATGTTRLADEEKLTERVRREAVLVLSGGADDRLGWLRVGETMELLWLQATAGGMSASVMTQALHLTEVRAQLREELGLAGPAHLLMRFGRPADR